MCLQQSLVRQLADEGCLWTLTQRTNNVKICTLAAKGECMLKKRQVNEDNELLSRFQQGEEAALSGMQ